MRTRSIRSHRNRRNSLSQDCSETAASHNHDRSSASNASLLADHASLLVLRLSASYRLLLDVHQVTVHARTARKRRNDAVRVAVLDLLVSERLFVQNVTVLHGHLAMEVRAHLVGQFGESKKSLEHLVDVSVPLGGDLEVRALLVSGDQLLDLLSLNFTVELAVALVPADHQGDVHVLFGLVFKAGLGLVDLLLEPLDLIKRLAVVQAENQDEHITCGQRNKESG